MATVPVPTVPSLAELFDTLSASLTAQGLVNENVLTAISRIAERVSELEHRVFSRLGSPSFKQWDGIEHHDAKPSTRGRTP